MVRYYYRRLKDGTMRRYVRGDPFHSYRCQRRTKYIGPNRHHPQPYNWPGPALDWTVWRAIADRGIRNPALILEQIRNQQEELRAQSDSCESEIARAEKKIESIGEERAGYQRQNARGKLTEAEFDARMAETEEALAYWEGELKRLRELRDDNAKVDAGLGYAQNLLASLQVDLPRIDQPPEELKRLPAQRRTEILKRRQEIIRALVDRVIIFADGRIRIEGLTDGDEGSNLA